MVMKCKRGIEVKGSLVPCGRCLHCRINKGAEWTSRIMMEWVTSTQPAWFVTLTYDEQQVPMTVDGDLTLEKKRFLKWVNNANCEVGPFRYYAVGEYGSDTLRPHYHMAVFPQGDCSIEQVTDRWKKGFTSTYELTPQRAAYLARYTTKKLTSHTDERLGVGQEPEFRTSTKKPPIGAAFIPSLVRAFSTGAGQQIVEQRGDVERTWRCGGKIYPVPRYILGKVRAELGIPRLHRDRLKHEGYAELHYADEFAEFEPEIANYEEMKWDAKTTANKLRRKTQSL